MSLSAHFYATKEWQYARSVVNNHSIIDVGNESLGRAVRTVVVKGRPVSVGASSASRSHWKNQVAAAASAVFPAPLVETDLKITITFFYNNPPDFDTDNISKPICDALKGIAYSDDSQLMERHARRRDLNGSFHIKGVEPSVAVAIAEGEEFVSIKIEIIGAGVAVI